MMLQISKELSLPIDAATQTFAFIARKGAGKTYGASKLAELMIDAGIQVVVLDQVGNWYGLRLAKDGKSSGIDIPIIGGLRGDIPIEATGGALIADVVVDSGRSLIVDTSQFSKADRQRFATAFGQRLWQRKKAERNPTPVMLMIEESQLIIPERVAGDSAAMVGIYEEIIRLGRNYGIGCTMITQRPQSVNKEVLNQTECLFVLQVNGAHERKSLKDWIVHQGMDVNLLNELPSLPIGTAYVWSPQWLGKLQKVQILQKRTYDASATPTVGNTNVRRELKPLDLDDLKAAMLATIETAKQNDPKELKRRIIQLEKERDLASKNQAPDARAIERAVNEATAPLNDKIRLLSHFVTRVEQISANLDSVIENIRLFELGEQANAVAESDEEREKKNGNPRLEVFSNPKVERVATEPVEPLDLTTPQERILGALASFQSLGVMELSRNNVAVFSAASPKSSAFTSNLSTLRNMGLLDTRPNSMLALTEAGKLKAVQYMIPISSVEDLHRAWYNKLPRSQVSILKLLIEYYPESLHRSTIATKTNQSIKSSQFTSNLSQLKKLGLVRNNGPEVEATELLFPSKPLALGAGK